MAAGIISFIIRIIIGGIFLVSGLAKIADPHRFIMTLREFQLFPEAIVPFTAVYLPWLEFFLGLFIVTGILWRTSCLILAFLNLLFTIAILTVIARGIEVDCGCFGLLADRLGIPDMADIKAVIRNLVFIAMNISIFRIKNTIFTLENHININRR